MVNNALEENCYSENAAEIQRHQLGLRTILSYNCYLYPFCITIFEKTNMIKNTEH